MENLARLLRHRVYPDNQIGHLLLMNRLYPTTIVLLFVFVALPTIDYRAVDIRMLQTASLDEAAFATQVKEMLTSGSLALDEFVYGSLYPYVGVAVSSIYGILFDLSDHAIIIILRLIGVGSAITVALYTYRIGQLLFGLRGGNLSAAVVLSTPLHFRWAVEIHPDLLQLAFLTAGLYHTLQLARNGDLYHLLMASTLAGLATATKYGGLFLLPTIALSLILGLPQPLSESLKDRRLWVGILSSFGVFATTFSLTNPYAISNLDRLAEDLSLASRIVSDQEGGGIEWITAIFSPTSGVALGLGLISTVFALVQKKWFYDRAHACLIFWVVTYVAFLVLNVRFTAGQYLLPVVPGLTLLTVSGLESLHSRLRLPQRQWATGLIIVLLHVGYAAPVYAHRTESGESDPVIAAGLWLAETYPEDTTILYDTYAYVPSRFALTETYFGQSYPVIELFDPDLVVTRKSIRDRYKDRNQSDHFRLTEDEQQQEAFLYLSPQRYRDIHFTYTYLEEGRTEYEQVRDFGAVTVYARRETSHRPDKADRWQSTAATQKDGGIDGQRAAQSYRDFGNIHSLAGVWEEAKTQYAKAASLNPSDVLTRYRYARMLAYQDSFDVAEDYVKEVVQAFGSPALVWLMLGWDYYEMGQFNRSRRASLRAHDHDPAHPLPLYNVALTYLVEGRQRKAANAYRKAVSSHPLPKETSDLLQHMIDNAKLTEGSRDLAQRVISGRL